MAHLDYTSRATIHAPTRQVGNTYKHGGKRCFDLVLALLMLPIVGPLVVFIVLINCITGGSGLFGHLRIGRDGRPFVCWKIQTMSKDSDRLLKQHLEGNLAAAKEWERKQKLSFDPRVTKFGGILRRTSLDELPQIWNVLRGDMSFVGPRPITADELRRYGPSEGEYRSVRPGITGIWQVYGRASGCYQERVKMDMTYCNSISVQRDLSLIAMTGLVFFRATGK